MPYNTMGGYGPPASYAPMQGFGGYGYDTGYPMPGYDNSYYGYNDGYYGAGSMYGRRPRHSYSVSLCGHPLVTSLFLNDCL